MLTVAGASGVLRRGSGRVLAAPAAGVGEGVYGGADEGRDLAGAGGGGSRGGNNWLEEEVRPGWETGLLSGAGRLAPKGAGAAVAGCGQSSSREEGRVDGGEIRGGSGNGPGSTEEIRVVSNCAGAEGVGGTGVGSDVGTVIPAGPGWLTEPGSMLPGRVGRFISGRSRAGSASASACEALNGLGASTESKEEIPTDAPHAESVEVLPGGPGPGSTLPGRG